LSFGQSSREKWTAPARAAAKKNPVTVNDTSIALGRKIYERQCLPCHGVHGKGDGPTAAHLEKRPGNLSSPKLWEQSDGALFWKVNEGHKPMPTFKNIMSDEERWPVINYVRTLAPKPAALDQPKGETKP
ncbi:MAG TPA: cytochrome c, partial [Chthoniobacterales bacterium]